MKLKVLPFALILITAGVVINCENVKALSIKEISTVEAQNTVDLKVYAGYGLTISFQKTEEKITHVFLSDPSRIVFSTNSKDCSKTENTSCQGAANVLFLRQIKPINFPNLTSSQDGGTQLVVLTNGKEGAKQYVFRILPVTGTPEYMSVVVSPVQDNYQEGQHLSLPSLQNTEQD